MPTHEFVSDYLQASSQDIVEVQEGMKKLALGSKHQGKDHLIDILYYALFLHETQVLGIDLVFTSSYENKYL